MENFFIDSNINCLENVNSKCIEYIGVYIKIFALLYADDTMLLSESADDLQDMLFTFERYCTEWKLSVNLDKTKVIIFSKRRSKIHFEFKLYGTVIDIVDSYSYLGILFNYNGNYLNARKRLVEQAQKAIFALRKKTSNLHLPIDLQMKLFDALVSPVLLYSSEIWGFENKNIIEKLHIQFLKQILSIRNSTPNYMVYGESGRYPLEVNIKLRMLNFWSKLLCENNKLSSSIYKLLYEMHSRGVCNTPWLEYVKSTLNELGLTYVWDSQISINRLDMAYIKQLLIDQFCQKWISDMI